MKDKIFIAGLMAIAFVASLNNVYAETLPTDSDDFLIPSWFKDVAGFYSQGVMSDLELVNNIEFLITEKILIVPSSASYAYGETIDSDIIMKLDNTTIKLDAITNEIQLIKTETDKIQTIQNNQYVPFRIPSEVHWMTTDICDEAGGMAQQHQLRINGDSDFVVTSITFQPTGLDEAKDEIAIIALWIDDQSLALRTGDLTSTSSTSYGFEILGLPTFTGGKIPTTITALGDGQQDIVVAFSCFADTTTDITFPDGSIVVSGWKLTSDTITASYD